ncbi:MAG TPA: tripartite tricarboxylate transporter substrate binding protein, partial [Steroidobacteraceae bacterium]
VARLLSAKLSEGLKQQVVVDNRPGAGATLGTEQAARAPADGYTLLITSFPSITTGPLTNPNVRYDPIEDFTHLALLGTFPNALVVRADSPLHSVAGLVAYAKANPGKVTYGSAGPASSGHMTGQLLAREAGIDIVHVPYKGAGPAFLDLLGGQIAADFDGMINAAKQAEAGKVRMLAVSSAARLASHPQLPTIAETVPGVSGESWFGVAAPAGLAQPLAARLESEITRAMAQPDVRARLGETGMTLSELRGAAVPEFIRADIRKWSPIASALRGSK